MLFSSVLDVAATDAEPQPLIEDAALAAALQEGLDRPVQEAMGQSVDARGVLRYGRPVPTLLQIAETEGANLVVCGTHGRRGLRRLVLGSVTEALARQASCPVLLVREGGDGLSSP